MTKTLKISGMTCNHCVNHVKNALEDLVEVRSADVSLENNTAVVALQADVSDETLRGAVEEVGYQIVSIENENS